MSDDSEQKSADSRMHHTGLTVADLDRSVKFYTEILGCTVENRFSVSGDAFETIVGREGVRGSSSTSMAMGGVSNSLSTSLRGLPAPLQNFPNPAERTSHFR